MAGCLLRWESCTIEPQESIDWIVEPGPHRRRMKQRYNQRSSLGRNLCVMYKVIVLRAWDRNCKPRGCFFYSLVFKEEGWEGVKSKGRRSLGVVRHIHCMERSRQHLDRPSQQSEGEEGAWSSQKKDERGSKAKVAVLLEVTSQIYCV